MRTCFSCNNPLPKGSLCTACLDLVLAGFQASLQYRKQLPEIVKKISLFSGQQTVTRELQILQVSRYLFLVGIAAYVWGSAKLTLSWIRGARYLGLDSWLSIALYSVAASAGTVLGLRIGRRLHVAFVRWIIEAPVRLKQPYLRRFLKSLTWIFSNPDCLFLIFGRLIAMGLIIVSFYFLKSRGVYFYSGPLLVAIAIMFVYFGCCVGAYLYGTWVDACLRCVKVKPT